MSYRLLLKFSLALLGTCAGAELSTPATLANSNASAQSVKPADTTNATAGVPISAALGAAANATARAQALPSAANASNSRARTGLAPGTTYTEEVAIEFAYLSTAAYCGRSLDSWDCGVACEEAPGMKDVRQVNSDRSGAHAFMGRLNDQCVLVFRGTMDGNRWARDFASLLLVKLPGCSYGGKACRVGEVFLQQYASIADGIKHQLSAIGCRASQPLAITGHNIGGALAALALLDLQQSGYNLTQAYTFGQPRVGNTAFAQAFAQALGSVPVYRVTRADDPFVYVPREDPFHHVGTEVYYLGSTSKGYGVCNGEGEDQSCSDRNPPYEITALFSRCLEPEACGHYLYLHATKRGLMSSLSCKAEQPSILLP